ncbi:M23 family metallopeptidase [Halopseudomonas sabulinigri]|uniref:M23 family metallopeptidase n=1 Tax=Halopseudomonas sabulinigri TaxID=472181 RepID=A0A1H1R333_9GAMM|nr:M23 family metallopeptidase [Halopseudomonas sabulinigri]SDS30148.1 Peptidase family M23 [Halopseudomonas sabulinigri]
MNIIILTGRHGASRTLTLGAPWVVAGIALLAALPVTAALLTWQLLSAGAPPPDEVAAVDSTPEWQQVLHDYDIGDVEADDGTQAQIERMSQQLARLQMRLTRLDALGERLTELADFSDGEFNFGDEIDPGMGGPELRSGDDLSYHAPDLQNVIEQLSERIDDRTQQLQLLEDLMVSRQSDVDSALDFKPVRLGHLSSGFGRRTDPITGRISMHTGLDFAAPRGTPIYAVGSGVVVFAGRNGAYGNMVEINHGGGYKTRYAHTSVIKVSKGDLVQKGEEIAAVGSTGRSTGSHLHLEVYRNGMAVNPARYVALK